MLSLITKIAGVVAVGKALSTTPMLFHRMMSGIALAMSYVIIAAMVVGAMLISGLYLIYLAFLRSGAEENVAMLSTALIAALVAGGLVAAAIAQLKKIKDIPQLIIQSEAPVASRVSSITGSFIDGFTHASNHSTATRRAS